MRAFIILDKDPAFNVKLLSDEGVKVQILDILLELSSIVGDRWTEKPPKEIYFQSGTTWGYSQLSKSFWNYACAYLACLFEEHKYRFDKDHVSKPIWESIKVHSEKDLRLTKGVLDFPIFTDVKFWRDDKNKPTSAPANINVVLTNRCWYVYKNLMFPMSYTKREKPSWLNEEEPRNSRVGRYQNALNGG
jgi:hypothetical protein